MPDDVNATERLFSYGTLQLGQVQLATFKRWLEGTIDELVGYEEVPLEIQDAAVVAISGKAVHGMARYTGRDEDRIAGTVFMMTPAELKQADGYEVAAVARVAVRLLSGTRAWAYVDAAAPGP